MNFGASMPRRRAVSSTTYPSPISTVSILLWLAKRSAALIAISGPMPLGSPMAMAIFMSERNRDQRIEARAVADHDALGEACCAGGVRRHLVSIAAGGEDLHLAVAHDAHDQERRLDLGDAVRLAQHHGQSDDVAIALALVDVGGAQRRDAVLQHGARIGVHHAAFETLGDILRRRHLVEALLEKE